MEPTVNVELIHQYFLAMGQSDIIYTMLLSEHLGLSDREVTNDIQQSSEVLLAMIAVTRYFKDYQITFDNQADNLVVSVLKKGDELFTFNIQNEVLQVRYPVDANTRINLNNYQVTENISVDLITAVSYWNTDTQTAVDIVEYLIAVHRLCNGYSDVTVLELLETKHRDVETHLKILNNIIGKLKNEPVAEEPVTPYLSQYNTPDEQAVEPDPQPLDIQELVTELNLYANIANKQNNTGVSIRTGSMGETVFGLGDVTQVITHWPIFTYGKNTTTLEETARHDVGGDDRQTFIEELEKGIIHQNVPFNINLIGGHLETIHTFIRVVLNMMKSGVAVTDVHFPATEIHKDDTDNDPLTRLWDTAESFYEEVLTAFNNNELVKLFDALGYEITRESTFNKTDHFTVNSFPTLICLEYASRLVASTQQHDSEKLTTFVSGYVANLVAIGWDKQALEDQGTTKLTNREHWVKSYGVEDVLSRFIQSLEKPMKRSDDLTPEIFKVPETQNLSDIRGHFNKSGLLNHLSHGVTSYQSDDTRVVYVKVNQEKEFTDELIIYIETKPDRIRIIPITYSSGNNLVDSINVFRSIRESEWPTILLYLQKTLTIGN